MRFFFVILLFPFLSFAMNYQEYIFLHNSNQCSNYFAHIEEKYNIPKNLLRSISVTETGRWHQNAKLYFTWPWAVNQAGQAYYFASKDEAVKGVKAMLEKGLTNIDIGCMQINLHHHPEAFLNLNQAFDPKENIEYAAIFLKKNYQISGDWRQAVAFYHSQEAIGKLYADKVIKLHSDYNNKKLYYDFCTSITGEIISCNNMITSSKENLPLFITNDTTDNMVLSINKPKKSSKRLRSNMIAYSINN